MGLRKCADSELEKPGCDDVLVRLPVLAVHLLGPVTDGLHVSVAGELAQGLLARLAPVQ